MTRPGRRSLMVGFFVAATVVTLVQFLRVRDRRLLPLLALFALPGRWPTAASAWDAWGAPLPPRPRARPGLAAARRCCRRGTARRP